MKLLIITQILDKNDPILGFFHRWVEEFAKNCEEVTVVCLKKGEHSLPSNVRVFSLGKEARVGRLVYLYRFYMLSWRERKHYDAVFVHMNQIYIILGAPLWRMLGKKVGLWYAHGAVSCSLRIALQLTQYVFTSTNEGLRINTPKKHIVGQGIDTNHFRYTASGNSLFACTVGRISRTKNIHILIEAVALLRQRGITFSLSLYGEPLTHNDVLYREELSLLVEQKELQQVVYFCGAVSQEALPNVLCRHDFFLNAGATGSLDKAVLEACAMGRIVISSNDSVRRFLYEIEGVLSVSCDPEAFCEAIGMVKKYPQERFSELQKKLSEVVQKEHSIQSLMPRILGVYAKL